MLIAEDEEGHHEPVAVASTINEAKEFAESDLRGRMRRLERGDDPGICPYTYKLWARGIEGDYRIAYEMDAATLKPTSAKIRSYYSRTIGRRVTIPDRD